MTCEIDIPWTPRTIKRSTTPKNQTLPFNTLLAIITDALKPFEEARIALSTALANFQAAAT